MANSEHLDKLHRGVEVWNDWKAAMDRRPNYFVADFRNADLRRANLIRADLMDADLCGADLTQADLSNADLSGALLNDANLLSTTLTRTDFTGASFRRASLIRSELFRANFTGAMLEGASFEHATITEMIFVDTNLDGALGLETINHRGPSTVDHRTLTRSGTLPLNFLRGCGLPDLLIDLIPALRNEGITFYSCFISYSHGDKRFAKRLYDALQGRGIRCWLDEHQLLPGDDIYEQIDQGIRLWDKTLLCCSKSSLTSWWVDSEIDTAFEKERALMKERGRKVLALIPLNLDGFLFTGACTSNKKRQISSRLAADFSSWETNTDSFDYQLDKVVLALRSDNGGRSAPPLSQL